MSRQYLCATSLCLPLNVRGASEGPVPNAQVCLRESFLCSSSGPGDCIAPPMAGELPCAANEVAYGAPLVIPMESSTLAVGGLSGPLPIAVAPAPHPRPP